MSAAAHGTNARESTATRGGNGRTPGLAMRRSSARYLVRYGLLTLGTALATFGLIGWTDLHFDLRGFWLYDNGWQLHPVHLLIVGIGLIPPAIWEIFVLETGRPRPQGTSDAEVGDGTAEAEWP